MTIHIIKLCVGVDSVDHLMELRKNNSRYRTLDYHYHITRFKPKKAEEILDGGSIYWVIKGFIQARQRIIGFDEIQTDQGVKCMIKMDKKVHLTESQPRRAFQGWRYFEENAAPNDISNNSEVADMPSQLKNDLKSLGLL
ncbi:MAG: DUF1489 domain-containing protein [Kordiimonadaceae bacterium]|nr:DUF1489 domain-containing protein [Kordiimonadaceae bacterium]